MKDTKFFPDNVSVAELTEEQYTRAIETCSTSTLKISVFDPDVLIDFASKVASIQDNGENVEIIATYNDISHCGSLVAIIYTDPVRYIGVSGMKYKENHEGI
jgi:hypothetical protein